MSRLLIIGCGGVAQVAIRKCCQNSEVFTEIMIASRTKSKCDDLKAKLDGKTEMSDGYSGTFELRLQRLMPTMWRN